MKAGYDARIRAKAERDEERIREAERVRLDAEFRASDPQGWLASLRRSHERLMARIKERKKLKEQLGDRKSLAAQNRMKSIANLANDDKPQKKRKRGQGEDDFGADDADWRVYKEIGGEDEDEAEDEEEELARVEARLLEHDETFTIDHTAARRALRKHQLLNAFVRGVSPGDPLDAYDPESAEHNAQLHLNIERYRVPEVVWQPHMGGLDQAGLGEMVEYVLRQFNQEDRDKLTSVSCIVHNDFHFPSLQRLLTPPYPPRPERLRDRQPHAHPRLRRPPAQRGPPQPAHELAARDRPLGRARPGARRVEGDGQVEQGGGGEEGGGDAGRV